MVNIQSNTVNLWGRVLMLLLIPACQYLIIKNGIMDGQTPPIGIVLLYIIVALFIFTFLWVIRSFFQILKVQIDESSGELIFKKPFSTVRINKQDIVGYHTTVYKGSRAKLWFGLLVQTVDNRSFRLTEQNLKSIDPVKEYFQKQNFTNLGEKRAFLFS